MTSRSEPTWDQTLRAQWSKLPQPWRQWIGQQVPKCPPPTPRNLWLLLAAAVATQNVAVFTSSQTPHVGVFALLIWGGSLICMEDLIETLVPRPRKLGLVLGSIIVLWIIIRSHAILSWEGILYLIPPIAGFALLLLVLPLREFGRFRYSLICLFMIPAYAVIIRKLPEEPLSLFNAQAAGFWLGILGLPAKISGRQVLLSNGGVTVLGACNGLDVIAQLVCISLIFLMAFPIRSSLSRIAVLVLAPIVALFSNTIRIALLALITTTGQGKGDSLFEFFHTETGSLLFSGVAVLIFGMLYMRLLERELPPLSDSNS